MRIRFTLTLAVIAAISIIPCPVSSETVELPPEGEMVKSMSFPKIWMPRIGVSYVLDGEAEGNQSGVEFNLSVYRDLLNPNMGIIGALFEVYGGQSNGEGTAGLRLMGQMKFFMFAGGADYSITEDDWSSIWSIQFPLRRGGLFGRGGDFRFDWLPGRENTFNFGINIPIGQPWMGKTRPKKGHVYLPKRSWKKKPEFEPSSDLAAVIEQIEESAFVIQDYTTFFSDDEFNLEKEKDIERIEEGVAEFKKYFHSTDEDHPGGHTFNAVINTYHRRLERAFTIACGGDPEHGREMADLAREVLLDEILLPHNRLLGQRKKGETI